MRFFLLLFLWISLIPASAHEAANIFVENGKMGLKDTNNNILIPADYEKLGWTNSAPVIVGNSIGYQLDGKWGLISTTNKVLTPPIYHSLEPGSGPVILGTKRNYAYRYLPMGVIKPNGEIVIPFSHPKIIEAENETFIIKKISDQKTRYGVVNGRNQIVINYQYEELQYLGNDRFAARKDGHWGMIDLEGKLLATFRYDWISRFTNGYAQIVRRRAFGIIDTSGRIIIEPEYAEIRLTGSDVTLAPFPQWDVLTRNNEKVHSVNFDSILPWEENRWKVIANNHEWLVDQNFDPVTSNSFNRISRLNNELALFSDEGKVGVIFQDGRRLIEASYDSLFENRERIFAHASTGVHIGWSMFGLNGNRLGPYSYQAVGREIEGGLIPVRRNNFWGFMSREGIELIPCTYEYIGMALANNIVVGFKGGEGIISRQGTWIVTPGEGKISLLNNSYYLLSKDNVNYLKHYEKGTVYFTANSLIAGDGYLVETREDGTFWKINLSGQIIEAHNNLDYQEIREMSEGFIAVKIHGRFGFIDEQDRLRIAYRYDDVKDFHEGLAAFKLMNKWGFLNKQENIVIQPMFEEVTSFRNGLAVVGRNGKKGVIDKTGHTRIPFEYDEISLLNTGRYLIRKNGRYGLLNESGMIIVNPQYDEVQDLEGGEVIVRRHDKYGLVSRMGDNLIPPVYDHMIFDPFNRIYLGMKKSESVTRPIR